MRGVDRRVQPQPEADCRDGAVRWSPVKSIWFTAMFLGWVIGGSAFFSWGALAAFFISCAVILCGGHSIGMHRKLIHDSFDCPLWLERLGVYLGTLVGLGGPFTMMYTHDMRDWAQRQTECHPFFTHQSHILKDFWWQIHCKLHLKHDVEFAFPEKLTGDKFMVGLQRTSMLQQIPVAILLFLIGGWGFVFWGVCGRVCVSIFGHWLVGFHAHDNERLDWIVDDVAIQGRNVKFCGLITFGECWHNNHHAFPESARIGLDAGQVDPGWWVLKGFERVGLVSNLNLPDDLPPRAALHYRA
ncbi:MAG: acyl-CoA desaturase [Maricaulaceae bacterium]